MKPVYSHSSDGSVTSVKDGSKPKFCGKGRKAIKSTQDKLNEWIQYYSSQKFGIWVECENETCGKWRWLSEYEEAEQIPKKWVCRMNSDPAHNSCEAEEHKLPARMYSQLEFEAGFIVWAQVPGYPSWPAIIEDCPDTDEFFRKTTKVSIRKVKVKKEYHVTFLDRVVTRAWVVDRSIHKLKIGDRLPALCGKYKQYKERLKEACEAAESALSLTLKERLEKFSFGKHHKGLFPVVDGSSDSEGEDILMDNLNETKDLMDEINALDNDFKGLREKDEREENSNSNEFAKKIENSKFFKSNSVSKKPAFSKIKKKKKSEGNHSEKETENTKEKIEGCERLKLKRKMDFVKPKNKIPKKSEMEVIDIQISPSNEIREISREAGNYNKSGFHSKNSHKESENSLNIEVDTDMNVITPSSLKKKKSSNGSKAGKLKSKKRIRKHKNTSSSAITGTQNLNDSEAIENSIIAMKGLKIEIVDEVCEKAKSGEQSDHERTSVIKMESGGAYDLNPTEMNNKLLKDDQELYDSDKELFHEYDSGLYDSGLISLELQDSEQWEKEVKVTNDMAENNVINTNIASKMDAKVGEAVEDKKTRSWIESVAENDVSAKTGPQKKGDVVFETDTKKMKKKGNYETNGKQKENVEDFDTSTKIKRSKRKGKKRQNASESNKNSGIWDKQNGLIQYLKIEDTSELDDQKVEIKKEKCVPDFSRKSKVFQPPILKVESSFLKENDVEEEVNKQPPPTEPIHDQNDSIVESMVNENIYFPATEGSSLLDEVVMKDTIQNDINDELLIANSQDHVLTNTDSFDAETIYPDENFGNSIYVDSNFYQEFPISSQIPDNSFEFLGNGRVDSPLSDTEHGFLDGDFSTEQNGLFDLEDEDSPPFD